MTVAALLTLADSRLPAGGHAHSGGAEEACAQGVIHDEVSLEAFLTRRLRTAGMTAATLAAQACRIAGSAPPTPPEPDPEADNPPTPLRAKPFQGVWGAEPPAGAWGGAPPGWRGGAPQNPRTQQDLDNEADARTPSPAQRRASRAQGRGLVRVARQAWPNRAWDDLPPNPHHPLALGVAALSAGLTPKDAALAAAYLSVTGPATAAQRLLGMDPMKVAAATARLAKAVDEIATHPHATPTDPLLDLLAEQHALRTERYFAS